MAPNISLLHYNKIFTLVNTSYIKKKSNNLCERLFCINFTKYCLLTFSLNLFFYENFIFNTKHIIVLHHNSRSTKTSETPTKQYVAQYLQNMNKLKTKSLFVTKIGIS